ncbi:MAG: hypothetical protein ACPGQS_10280 [Bradymonadia bacterium]
MAEDTNADLSSGLGLACRIALDVINKGDKSDDFKREVRTTLLESLEQLSEADVKRLRDELAKGIDELTASGRFKGRRKLEGRLTTIESHVVRDFLRSQGVDAELRRVADVMNPVFCVEVWVRPIHHEKAQRLMETLTDSRGSVNACDACGEQSPAGFALCWNCGSQLTADSTAP